MGGLSCATAVFGTHQWTFTPQHLQLFGFLVLAAVGGGKKINLIKQKGMEETVSMSLGFAITFAALQRFGMVGGVSTAIVAGLSGCLFPKRQAPFQIYFNVALGALEATFGSYIYMLLSNWSLQVTAEKTLLAVCASTLAFYAVNTGGVAVIIALCSRKAVFKLWKETFLWTAPSYFAGAAVSTLALIIFGLKVGFTLVFVLPIVYLTYVSYSTYTSRAEEKQKHIEELQRGKAELADLYLATIKSLALAIDAKDQYTHQHILRVQRYSVAIAEEVGLSGVDLEAVNTGALLHDIGKLGVPEYVLLKPGRLTEDEFDKIKKHPEIGAAILDPVSFPWPVVPVVKHHHEKWDGSGYPDGLVGEAIPLTARILAVADVYDALTSSRSYRHAWSHEHAIETIIKGAGTHFDPELVEPACRAIDRVVHEMEQEGNGPLTATPAEPTKLTSKAAKAAQDISRVSTEFWALYEVAQTLSASLGLAETVEILARKLEAIFPGSACVFMFLDDKKESMLVQTAVGTNKEFFTGAKTLRKDSISLQSALNKVTFLGKFDHDDLMMNANEGSNWVAIESMMIAPVQYNGQALGSINLYHSDVSAFNEHDLHLLQTIADRAAMAIYNGILYDRSRGHAFTDPLTGLYNLRYLTEQVDNKCQISAMEGKEFTLLVLDLDSFKPINDNFGHQKGNTVLVDVANIFKSLVRSGDIVARYGGDEFVVVIDGADTNIAIQIADKIRSAVESYDPELIHMKLGSLRLGASIGFATFPKDGTDCAALMAAADIAMYKEKSERKLLNLVDHKSSDPKAS